MTIPTHEPADPPIGPTLASTRPRFYWLVGVALVTGLVAYGMGANRDPVECWEALDRADDLDVVQLQGLSAAADALTAVGTFDSDAMGIATRKIEGLTPIHQDRTEEYAVAAETCRDS